MTWLMISSKLFSKVLLQSFIMIYFHNNRWTLIYWEHLGRFLHSQGIIYCDLKPSNILLDEFGCMKVLTEPQQNYHSTIKAGHNNSKPMLFFFRFVVPAVWFWISKALKRHRENQSWRCKLSFSFSTRFPFLMFSFPFDLYPYA
jgi:serine/threonine protein kinase